MREKSSVEYSDLPNRPTSSNLRILRNVLPLLKPYKLPIAIALVSLLLAALSTLGIGIGVKTLVDRAFREEDSTGLTYSLLLLLGCVIVMAIASFGRTYYVSWLGERVIADLRQKTFRHLLTLDVGYFEMIRPGELMSRLTTDTTLIQIVVGTSAALALRNFMIIIGGGVMMLITSPTLTLYATLIVPLVLIPLISLGRRVKNQSRKTQDSIAQLSGFLEESLSSIRTCYAFNHELRETQNFRNSSEANFTISVHQLLLKSWLTFLVMILVFTAVMGLLWVGGQNVLEGTMTAGQLSSFLVYAVMVAGSMGSFSEIAADLQRAAGAAERLFDIISTPSKIKAPANSRLLPSTPRGIVAFHNVSFAYPNNPKHPILNNVTLSIAPGEKVAIVGPSGSGKSTILSLLLRFFDPQSGSIYVDGLDIKDVPLDDLRGRFGIVPQDPMIFSGSLYENILYGHPNATETEVWQAAEAAYLTDFIKTLPEGIHTLLGTRGVRLSGGQKQRLAIARVILRQAPILLLDEATSALDAQSEKFIQESLKKIMMTRTTLVVAHRLATVLKADRIVVLNRGGIEAVGTHAELISEDGLYRRLATLQFTDSLNMNDRRYEDRALWG